MLALPFDRLLGSLGETLVMTAVSGAISFAVGLPLGLVLVGTAPGGFWENRWVNGSVGAIVNGFRSLPFIILLVAVIPLTRILVGTSIGTAAAIVPLSISGIPYFGRVAEVALREVDRGLIEAVRAMGGGNWTIIREALVPEALPSLIAGFTVTLNCCSSARPPWRARSGQGPRRSRITTATSDSRPPGHDRRDRRPIALVALIQAGGDRLARSDRPPLTDGGARGVQAFRRAELSDPGPNVVGEDPATAIAGIGWVVGVAMGFGAP
jgi:D-methionine transport system permease protein